MIVDDHPVVRRGLREMVDEEPDMEVAAEAADMAEALGQLEVARPDLVIVDLTLKNGHGLELIETIRDRDARVKMLVLSMHDDLLYAERALRCGASGYINKQEPPENVIAAMREVLRGQVYVSDEVADVVLRRLSAGQSLQQNPIESLTNRELEIFELIGRGLSVKQIAKRLDISYKTVEAHRDRIRGKLNVSNSLEVSRRAMQWTLEGS
jgi:DNA-binding NarL/FixJ family response regulator